MKKIIPIITVLLLFTHILFAQKSKQTTIDSLQIVLKVAKEDTNQVNALNALAVMFNSPDSSIEQSKKALTLAEKLKWQTGVGKSYYNLGNFLYDKDDYYTSLDYYSKALTLFDKPEKPGLNSGSRILRLKSTIIGCMANVYNKLCDYPKAIEYYSNALKIKENLGDKNEIAGALGNIGIFYFYQGDYGKTLEYYNKAYKIYEELNNKNGIAGSLGIFADLYWSEGNLPEALEYLFRAVKIHEEIEDKSGIAGNFGDIGLIYQDQKDFPKALEYDFKSFDIYNEIGQKAAAAIILGNISGVYNDQKDYSKALEYNFRALKIWKEIRDKKAIAFTYGAVGLDYIQQNKLIEADRYLTEGLKLATDINALDLIRDDNNKLSELYIKKGDWKKAYEHYKLAIAAKDSINNEEKTKKTTRLEMNYEFDKEAATQAEQEKKNAISKAEIKRQKLIKNATFGGFGIAGIFSFLLVRAVNRRRRTTFDKQVSEVEMKALRSQMNPHFIFNSLNSIDDYIQKNDIENSSKYLNKFSRLTRAILESSRMEEVPLKNHLETLDLYIQLENLRMRNKIIYSINITPELNTEQTLIPPMLLQPFVENAFKHAFTGIENPRMDINIALQDGMVVCTVKDNGVGRGKSQVITIEEKTKHESLGLKVTQERLEIINRIKKSKAYIAFEDLKDGNMQAVGTKVQLAIPVSYMF